MKDKFFSKNKIKKTLDSVLLDNNLKVLYNMSTSGDFVVKHCTDADGKNFILKIRRRSSDELRRQFVNEVFAIKFLSEKSYSKFPFNIISHSVTLGSEFLLYEMIDGVPLNGYYFLVGKRNKGEYDISSIVDLISWLQKDENGFIGSNSSIKLVENNYSKSVEYFSSYKDIYVKYFGDNCFGSAIKILEQNKELLNKDLVLSHGDLNPKNILVKTEDGITFIDWTDVCVDNKLSDVVRLYLSSWNVPRKQERLKSLSFNEILNSKDLFNVNIIILIGNFLKILENSHIGLNDDFEKKLIDKESMNKMIERIEQARSFGIDQFKKSLKYFNVC